LNSHPDIKLANEMPLLPQLANRFDAEIPGALVSEFAAALRSGDVYRQLHNSAADLSRFAALPTVAASEIYSVMLTEHDATWKGNKTPQNTENIGPLLQLFPDSYFILVTRDVRDVCLSWRNKWGKHVLRCAGKWRARMLQGCQSLATLGENRGLIVRYEDLLRETETVGRQICEFLNVPFESRMVAYHEHVSKVIDGHKNYGRPIDSSNVGKWRVGLSRREVHRIEEIAYDTMQHLGYQPQSARQARPITPIERTIGLGTDCFATVFIGNRYKSQGRLSARAVSLGIILRRWLANNSPGSR
jgi:hypothetical protein